MRQRGQVDRIEAHRASDTHGGELTARDESLHRPWIDAEEVGHLLGCQQRGVAISRHGRVTTIALVGFGRFVAASRRPSLSARRLRGRLVVGPLVDLEKGELTSLGPH
jgi:hypothetical protein